MPLDPRRLQDIHERLRACFKGQLKSANKAYLPLSEAKVAPGKGHMVVMPSSAQRIARYVNVGPARDAINALQDDFRKHKVQPAQRGFQVLNQENLAGNCGEMAAAAVYLVTRENAGIAYLANIEAPGDHAFCLVTDGAPPSQDFVATYEFALGQAWVIDAWANVCCPVQNYRAQFTQQMMRWSRQGKQVLIENPRGVLRFQDPAGHNHLFDIAGCKVHYFGAGPMPASGTPRALLREAKPAPRKPGWQALDD